jgi:hypothetical protein
MAFIENIRFYRKLGFVVYGNEYAAMPKIIISAQAVIDAIEKQEIYRLTGPAAWRYWPQSAALHRGRAGNLNTGKIFVIMKPTIFFFVFASRTPKPTLPSSSIKRTPAVSNAV